MADLGVLTPLAESFHLSNETPDNLALELSSTPKDNLFRPSLADNQKIGFFRLDRVTQTDVTEIIQIKQLTENVHQLLEDAQTMRRDINFAQSVMQADFENKLQQKAIDMYVRVNEKVSEIEKMQEERVNTVRRAFKQQLSDAIVRLHAHYEKEFARRLDRERSQKDRDAAKWEKQYRELQKTLAQNQGLVDMLKQQLQDCQEREEESPRVYVWSEDGTETKSPSAHHSPEQVIVTKTPSPDLAKEQELQDLRDEVAKLEENIESLTEDLNEKDNVIIELKKEIDILTDELEKERVMNGQLLYEKEELANRNEYDKAASKHMEKQMEKMQLEQAKEMEEHLKRMKDQILAESQAELDQQQQKQNDRIRQLTEEKRMVEELLAKAKSEKKVQSKDKDELERVKRNEQRLVAEVAKLKREIERVHMIWEKKFAILQQSLHALKDESFLRQTMQRQAVQLHQAAISYAYDSPAQIAPSSEKSILPPAKKPLPGISVKGQRVKSPSADYISYTVSAPSGRATTLFSADENQIMSDDEQDLPSDVCPLPSPPTRDVGDNNESRPSTEKSKSSHIVVMPSTNDQI